MHVLYQCGQCSCDFELNRTKIKSGYQSGRKKVAHDSKSDLPLAVYCVGIVLQFYLQPYINRQLSINIRLLILIGLNTMVSELQNKRCRISLFYISLGYSTPRNFKSILSYLQKHVTQGESWPGEKKVVVKPKCNSSLTLTKGKL